MKQDTTQKSDNGAMTSNGVSRAPSDQSVAQKARGMASNVSEKFSGMKDRIRNVDFSNLQDRTVSGLKNFGNSASTFVRERPYAALGIAAVAGFLTASLLRNRD